MTKIAERIGVIDCTPRNLLTHKQLLEKATCLVTMIERQSERVNNRRQWRTSILYRAFVDERRILISEMALNRLINSYNNLRWQFMETTLPNTEKSYIEF